MSSLQSRLALLLILAIVGVVFIASVVSLQVLERPDRTSFTQTFAEEVRIVSHILVTDPSSAERLGIVVGPEPVASSDTRIRDGQKIEDVLAEGGIHIDIRIVGDPSSGTRQLALEFQPGRWAFLPYPAFPPRNMPAFVFYMALIVIGAAVVALYAAAKITRPLKLLDEAVSTVGSAGLPAHVPEDGPAEVRATAAALNRLTARVREAVESRMRLVAAAGHDLRTPMTRMRLRAEFLPEEDREVWLKDLAELDRIADSAIRLVREEVDPSPLESLRIDRLVLEIAEELEEIGRTVDASRIDVEPVSVAAKPLALKRALRNLIDNAANHGGGVRMRLRREASEAILTITDDGPGIPEEMIGRAFEPFFRVDLGRRQLKPGAGLGMAIAKEILDQAGGSIRVANRPEGGLEQTVRMPVAPQRAPA